MFGIGMTELIIILVIVLIVFGAGKLPEIGAGLGKAISNFKKSSQESSSVDKTTSLTDITPEQKPKKENLDEKPW